MSFLLPLLPSLISTGAGLLGSYQENKRAKRAERRAGQMGQFNALPGEEKRFQQFTPEQQNITQLLQNILTGQGQQPGGLLGETYGDQGFDAYADPVIRKYNEEIVPKIAERFSGLGSGAQSSSAFQNLLAQSGSNLARDLGEMRSRRRQESTQNLLSQTLQPQFHTRYEQKMPTGAFQGLAGSGFENITKILTDLLQDYAKRSKKQQGSFINSSGQITGPMY